VSTVIWFNDGLSVMAEAIQALRSEPSTISKIIVSHKNPFFVGLDLADESFIEETGLKAADYLDWALAFADANAVTHFFVGRHAQHISKHTGLFSDIGVTLMFSLEPEQWDDIDDKSKFYKRLANAGHDFMLPIWHIWEDNYHHALKPLVDSILSSPSEVPREACVKPVRGIFGQGFFRFNDSPDPEQQLFFPEEKIMNFADFGKLACDAFTKSNKIREWMVMEYLPGPEYSVDTLAYKGEIVTFVARKKSDVASEGQVIVDDADIVDQLDILAKEFELSGVFNAQFRRDVDGKLKVMEINPRFSGGMGMSLIAGVNLPLWWLNVVLSEGKLAVNAPKARAGMRVYSWHKAVEITDHRDNA
jgi:hypothetical protein